MHTYVSSDTNVALDQLPYVRICIFGQNVDALKDSGASASLISYQWINKHAPQVLLDCERLSNMVLNTASQAGSSRIFGRIKLPLIFKNKKGEMFTIEHAVYIATDIQHDFFLANDILSSNIVDHETPNYILFRTPQNGRISIPVYQRSRSKVDANRSNMYPLKEHYLKPGDFITIPCNTRTRNIVPLPHTASITNVSEDDDLVIETFLNVDSDRRTYLVSVLNETNEVVHLHRFKSVAIFTSYARLQLRPNTELDDAVAEEKQFIRNIRTNMQSRKAFSSKSKQRKAANNDIGFQAAVSRLREKNIRTADALQRRGVHEPQRSRLLREINCIELNNCSIHADEFGDRIASSITYKAAADNHLREVRLSDPTGVFNKPLKVEDVEMPPFKMTPAIAARQGQIKADARRRKEKAEGIKPSSEYSPLLNSPPTMTREERTFIHAQIQREPAATAEEKQDMLRTTYRGGTTRDQSRVTWTKSRAT
jgi:hypothetical protein